MGTMTNSARRKRRVSYLGESALGENTGIEVSQGIDDEERQRSRQRAVGMMDKRRPGRSQQEGERPLRGMGTKTRIGTHINRHVFPQAPSPTMTSFRRSSAILEEAFDLGWWRLKEDAELTSCTKWNARHDSKRATHGKGEMS